MVFLEALIYHDIIQLDTIASVLGADLEKLAKDDAKPYALKSKKVLSSLLLSLQLYFDINFSSFYCLLAASLDLPKAVLYSRMSNKFEYEIMDRQPH